jgi:hypothetical protein
MAKSKPLPKSPETVPPTTTQPPAVKAEETEGAVVTYNYKVVDGSQFGNCEEVQESLNFHGRHGWMLLAVDLRGRYIFCRHAS